MWELEVGHTVAPDQGLPETISPDGFDDPNTLAAFVDAVRWGAVTSADGNAFQAPFRSGANVEAYQLEPLRRALQSARTNLLLADDVGLGKTIEAGLVIQELLLRHRARSVDHRVPAEPVAEVAGRDAGEVRPGIRDRQQRADGEGAAHPRAERQPVPAVPAGDRVHGVAAVAARPAAAARRVRRRPGHRAAARRYAFDVLIVDEAHHVAPASPTAVTGFRGYAVDSQRTVATQGAGREVRAPAVPVRDPAQRLLRVVHRADGDDRRPPVQARRQPGRARAARHRGPPPQGGPART